MGRDGQWDTIEAIEQWDMAPPPQASTQFQAFLKLILKQDPSQRSTPIELLHHLFLANMQRHSAAAAVQEAIATHSGQVWLIGQHPLGIGRIEMWEG